MKQGDTYTLHLRERTPLRLASALVDALPKTAAESVPEIYHDYLDVFNKEAADELPPTDHMTIQFHL